MIIMIALPRRLRNLIIRFLTFLVVAHAYTFRPLRRRKGVPDMRRSLRALIACVALLIGGATIAAPVAQAVEPQLAIVSFPAGSCTNTTPVMEVKVTPVTGEVVFGIGYQIKGANPVQLYAAPNINGLAPGNYTLTLPGIQPGTSVEFRALYSSAVYGGDVPPVFTDYVVFTAGTNCNGDPVDTDGDGFNDSVDPCPTVYSTVNGGCPVVVPPPAEQSTVCKVKTRLVGKFEAMITDHQRRGLPTQGLERALQNHKKAAARACK